MGNSERTKRWREKHPNYFKEYYAKNRDKLRKYNREWKRTNRSRVCKLESEARYRLKREVMAHYSTTKTAKCVRCGIDDLRVLCIDHVNGGGAEHLREINVGGGASFYRWLKRNDYPKGYQILCLNCNVIKRIENKEYSVHGYKHGAENHAK